MIESDTKGMFRDRATLKCLFKMCFSEIYHPISFFEGSAPVFLAQHHKLGHDLSLFSHRISPSILFFLFVHSWGRWKTFGSHGWRMISPAQRGKGKVLLVNAALFLMTVQAFQPRAQPCFQCPFDWIRYRGKCYYFSEVEGNWTSSQDNCSALGASLAMLDSMEDLVSRHEDLLSTGNKPKSNVFETSWFLWLLFQDLFWRSGVRSWGKGLEGMTSWVSSNSSPKPTAARTVGINLFLDDTFWKQIEMFKPQRSPKAAQTTGKIEIFGWKKVKTFPFPLFQNFVRRYKGISEHWIGVWREDEEQPWQWVNRSPVSHLWVHVFHYYVVGWCFLSCKMCISYTWATPRGSNGTIFGKGNIASGTGLCVPLWPKRWEWCVWWENPKSRFFILSLFFACKTLGFILEIDQCQCWNIDIELVLFV